MNVAKALVYRFIVSMLADPQDQKQLLSELQVEPSASQHPLDEFVSVESLNTAHHRLAEITGDNFVSWRFGYLFELDSIGVLGLLWRHASNLEDMIALHVKFLGVLLDVATAEFTEVEGGKKVEWTPVSDWEAEDPVAVEREFEAAIGFFSKAIQVMTGEPVMPLSINLKRQHPSSVPEAFRPYLDLTNFNSPKHSIVIRHEDLVKPLVSFNPHMLVSMEQYLESVLAGLPRSSGFTSAVEREILKVFPTRILSVDELAQHFHMSTRNFQRKLIDSGESYREMINRIKLDFAKQQLRNTELSIGEIGFLLGYTEPPAFIRFFKKRCGISPTQFRAEALSA